MKADLKVDFCDYKAAEWAVKHWHYSKSLPYAAKMVKVGVWEAGNFIGAVLFSWGANNQIGSPYGLKQVEVCELVRVALSEHLSPVSQIVTLAIKLLRKHSPGLKMIVSFADPQRGHLGKIYQAMNWVYVGQVQSTSLYFINGRWMHRRMASQTLGSIKGLKGKRLPDKHKYLYPLDRAMRRQIAPLAKPYPKRESMRLTDGSTLTHQLGGGDSTSTQPLQLTGQPPRRVSGDPLGRH